MATATATTKGFALRCPHCGESDTMRLELADVGSLTCSSCDNETTAEDIRAVIAGWERLLRWVATAPVRED